MSRTPPPVIRVSLQEALHEEWRRTMMSEFALILAAKGHAVDYQTLERLADVAIGDV
jgi:hypothetical protein